MLIRAAVPDVVCGRGLVIVELCACVCEELLCAWGLVFVDCNRVRCLEEDMAVAACCILLKAEGVRGGWRLWTCGKHQEICTLVDLRREFCAILLVERRESLQHFED